VIGVSIGTASSPRAHAHRATVAACTYVDMMEGALMNLPGDTNTSVTLLDNRVHGFVWCTNKVLSPSPWAHMPYGISGSLCGCAHKSIAAWPHAHTSPIICGCLWLLVVVPTPHPALEVEVASAVLVRAKRPARSC
jgi:hypothetical protein